MTFVNLNPNGTVSNNGTVTGSSAHAALSDSSDASYVTFLSGQAGRFSLTDLSLPSGALLVLAQVFLRTKTGFGNAAITGALIADSTKTGSLSVTWGTPTDAAVPVAATDVTDAGLDAADLSLSMWMPGQSVLVYKAWVRVLYLTRPTLTVNAPSGTVSSNKVTVSWTPSFDVHTSGVPFFQMKIFSQAQYSAGGFNPETTPATFYAGSVVQSAATSVSTSQGLPDGTYRAYVKTAAGNAPDHWSDWAYSGFVVDALEPGVPSIVLTSQGSSGRIKVDVSATSGDVPTNSIQVQRDRGGGFEDLRDQVTGTSGTIYDYEAPNGVMCTYRARAWNDAQRTWSAWSATDTESWSSSDEWLKNVLDPSRNLKLVVRSYPSFDVPANSQPHRALGSSKAITTQDVPGPEQGQIVLFSKSEQDRANLKAYLAAGGVTLLQVPGHPDRYVTFGDRSSTRVVDTAGQQWHEESLGWTEVETP